jgi:uncharacterized protein YkwD
MMKLKLSRITVMFLTVSSLFVLTAVASANFSLDEPVGTIRGGVYQDINGDGRCENDEVERRLAVPGIKLHFSASDSRFTLYSGADGTYGLIPVTPNSWQVEVKPNPIEWLATSPNPLQVQVTPGQGAVQTAVNFCLLRISGPSLTSLPVGVGEAGRSPVSAPDEQASAEPESDSLDLDPFVERAIISIALLSDPPEPRPLDNIEEILEVAVDEEATPAAEWLGYLNRFRQVGGLPPLNEDESLTFGSQWHSRYMVVNDTPIAHSEDKANALYDPAGQQAAQNGNIFATTQFEAGYTWVMNFWISAPFHLAPIIDPGLADVGFGQHNQEVGTFRMAAVLDARSGLGDAPAEVTYPLYFPDDGASTWVVRHSLYEWPDPMSSCQGYSRPSGPPLVLQLGDGSLTPRVGSHAIYVDDQLLESCLFDETSYSNPDPFAQSTGRDILGERDAVVIIPRHPLAVNRSYRVEITAGGQIYNWQFTTQPAP